MTGIILCDIRAETSKGAGWAFRPAPPNGARGSVSANVVHQPIPAAQDQRLIGELSDREREVLALLATGPNNAEIAQRRFLSEGTVKNYVSVVFSKLGVTDRTQAAILAIRAGLAGPE